MRGIKFSIITPVYNAAGYLPDTLRHLSQFKPEDFDIYFINDGSTDDSGAILNDYCSEHKNAQVITQQHRGVSAARNVGLNVAGGDYILFLDADDSFLPDIFSILRECITENAADIIVFGAKVVNYDPRYTLNDIEPRNIIYRKFEPQALFDEAGTRPYVWNCTYKTSFVKGKNLQFDEDISLGEDHLFQFTAFPQASVIQFISDKLYRYNYLKEKSIVSKSVDNVLFRCERHIILASKVISSLKMINIYNLFETDILVWQYQFLKTDIHSLNKSQFKIAAMILKQSLKNNSIRISKLPLNTRKKLSYYSLINYSLHILRQIIKR